VEAAAAAAARRRRHPRCCCACARLSHRGGRTPCATAATVEAATSSLSSVTEKQSLERVTLQRVRAADVAPLLKSGGHGPFPCTDRAASASSPVASLPLQAGGGAEAGRPPSRRRGRLVWWWLQRRHDALLLRRTGSSITVQQLSSSIEAPPPLIRAPSPLNRALPAMPCAAVELLPGGHGWASGAPLTPPPSSLAGAHGLAGDPPLCFPPSRPERGARHWPTSSPRFLCHGVCFGCWRNEGFCMFAPPR
jgi:hypothetical protein